MPHLFDVCFLPFSYCLFMLRFIIVPMYFAFLDIVQNLTSFSFFEVSRYKVLNGVKMFTCIKCASLPNAANQQLHFLFGNHVPSRCENYRYS